MLLELLAFVVLTFVLASTGLVLVTAYKSRVALNDFKKRSGDIPMLDGANWIYNHALFPIKRDLTRFLMEMHAKYGNTVGWLYRQQFAASTLDLDLIKILNQDEVQQHIDKIRSDVPLKEFAESIVSIGGNEWRRVRRAFAPALKSNKFKTPVVIEEIRSSIDKLIGHIERQIDRSEHNSVIMDVDEMCHKYSIDLVLKCFFGQSEGIDFDAKQCKWTSTINLGFRAMQESRIFKLAIAFPVLVPLVDWLMWHFHPHMSHWRKEIMNFVTEQLKRGIELRRQLKKLRQSSKQDAVSDAPLKRNLTDYAIDQFLEGKITRDEYIASSCFMMPAADKTSSDTIARTLYLLATHASAQDKVRESIRKSGADSEYLSWVLDEALRLLPPAASGCGRITTRDLKTKEGYTLPAGTYLSTPAYIIHRIKKYWGDDAEEFRPERWADTSKHHPFQYIPFGGGLRVCPGRDFALFQMKMVLTELLTRYSFTCKPKTDMDSFDTPYFQTTILRSPTCVTIKRF